MAYKLYNKPIPDMEDFVMVKVIDINNIAANVHLLGYNEDLKGMILFSELSRTRIRCIKSHINKDQKLILRVINIHNKYIDLSKKQISQEDKDTCNGRYKAAKRLYKYFSAISDKLNLNLDDIYNNFIWPLCELKQCETYDILNLIRDNEEILNTFDIDDSFKNRLIIDIQTQFIPKKLKIQSIIEVTCFSYSGITGIVATFNRIQMIFPQIKIIVIGAPLYSFTIISSADDSKESVKVLEQAINAAKEEMHKYKGNISIKSPPEIVS